LCAGIFQCDLQNTNIFVGKKDASLWHSLNHLGTQYFTHWSNGELLTYNGFIQGFNNKAYSAGGCAGFKYLSKTKFFAAKVAIKTFILYTGQVHGVTFHVIWKCFTSANLILRPRKFAKLVCQIGSTIYGINNMHKLNRPVFPIYWCSQ
jgi:hypothetical protein